MSKIKLGKIAITPKGEYASGTIYERLDAVKYNGSSWLVLQRCSGVTPTEGAFYTLLAEKGGKGDRGLSAYELWLAQGNKGTEAEFVASLSNQSDWNENNETAAGFVKNRTHYVIPATEARTNTLTWDGDTTGKTIVNINADVVRSFVKMSDYVCTAEDLIGGTLIVIAERGELTLQITREMVHSYPDDNILTIEREFENNSNWAHLVIAVEDTALNGAVITKGIYFVNGKFEYTSSFTAVTDCFTLIGEETVVPLDGKFLPKGLGYIIKEGLQTKTNTLTFDGNIGGKEVIDGHVKMSDEVITVNDLIGATVVLSMGGEEVSATLTSDDIQDFSTEGTPLIIVDSQTVGAEMILIMLEDLSDGGVTATKGTYFTYFGETSYTKSLTCLTDCFVVGTPTEVKKIDNRLLDVEWLAVKKAVEVDVVPEMSLEVTLLNDTAQHNFSDGDEGYFELEVGKTYHVYFDGTKYTCTAKTIDVGTAVITYIGSLASLGLADTGEPFGYYLLSGANGKSVLVTNLTSDTTITYRVTEEQSAYDKLPEEYLPETLLATIADLTARIAKLEGATE